MTELHQHTGQPPRITVLLDSSNEGVRKQFHCPVCGTVSFEYYGELRGLVPGSQVTEKTGARTVIHCKGKVNLFDVDGGGDLVKVREKDSYHNPKEVFVPCKAQFYV